MLERKKLKSRNHGVSESLSFLVRNRRTYVVKKAQMERKVSLKKGYKDELNLPSGIWAT